VGCDVVGDVVEVVEDFDGVLELVVGHSQASSVS
jgi:hypothetical protein